MTLRELLDAVELQTSEAVFCYYDYAKEERVEITERQARDFDIRYIYTDVYYLDADKQIAQTRIFIEVGVEEDDEIPEDNEADKKFDLVFIQRRSANVYASLDNRTGEPVYLRLNSGREIVIPADGAKVMTYSEEDVLAVNAIAYDEYVVED